MSEIIEKMSRMDRANYNRLNASIKPTQNKIEKEKIKLQLIITESTNKIKEWESQIADFKNLATSIENKYANKVSSDESNLENNIENNIEDDSKYPDLNTLCASGSIGE